MLKIKDNVDLRELQKFGFKSVITDKANVRWYYNSYNDDFAFYIDIFENRHIETSVCTGYFDCSINSDELANLLFDLFQAGLIEKVEEVK